jgi:hypothetical protein
MTTYDMLPRRVNFNWINESFNLVLRDVWIWLLALIIQYAVGFAVGEAVQLGFTSTGHPLTVPPVGPVSPTLSGMSHMFTPYYWICLATSSIVSLPITGFFYAGLFNMANKSVRGQKLTLSDIFSGGPNTLNFIILNFVIMIVYYVSFIVGIIIGGFVAVGLLFPAFSLTAAGKAPLAAMGDSFNAMKQDWLRSAGFVFVLGLVVMASYCCCFLPILITTPMCYIVCALAARDMLGAIAPVEVLPPPTPGSWPPPPNYNFPSGAPPPNQGTWPPKNDNPRPDDPSNPNRG